jgi:hypothetical protein
MQTYIDEHFDSKYCYDANCGAFLLAYVKKVTVADKRRYSELRQKMKRAGVKFVPSPGKPFTEEHLMLDALLFE